MKLINTKEYLLLIDSVLKNVDYYIDDIGELRKCVVDGDDYFEYRQNYQKVIAYYRLTEKVKELDLPLLPDHFKINIVQIAKEAIPSTDKHYTFKRHGFVTGYKLAQSKYQFTLEDIKDAISFGYNTGYYNGREKEDYIRPDEGEDFEEFIKLLSTSKQPTEFIPEYNIITTDNSNDFINPLVVGTFEQFTYKDFKTVTNSQGKQVIQGTYKY